ncbi:DUF4347 domain-containing protein, partial [Flavobacterium sp.]|uniref:DUF4347 domain-containing protein n=1 Tax=Flavobacterium sp. TaxID=239 RepID=UPI0037C08F8D
MKNNKHQILPLMLVTPSDAPCFSEVAFIASELADRATLVQTLREGVTHVILDKARDGLDQITRYLSNHHIRVLHIVSHGGAGFIELGSIRLNRDTFSQYESELREIGELLAADAEIHLYGCEVSSTAAGAAFTEMLSEITGASVAASENLTGSASLGGDWDLETHIGQISAPMAFDVTAVQAYAGVLAASDENFDSRSQTDTTGTSVNVGNWTFTANINSEFVVSDDNYYLGYLNGSGDKSLIWNADGTAANQFNFYATDFSAFKLNSFQLGALTGSTSITISSYLNNSQLTSATFNLNQSSTLGGITYNKDSNGNFGTLTFDSTFQNIDKIQLIFSGSSTPEIDSIDVSAPVIPPEITSASFDASTGVLTVTGTNLSATVGATNDIDVSKLTLKGEGGNTYTLTSSNVEISSSTSFSVTLNSTDQTNVNGLLNKNGTSSVYGTTYNLAGAAGWNVAASSASDTTGNGVIVTNVTNPTITSATFDAATGVLNVSGVNLVKQVGANNDITVSTLTITGEGGNTYTLTSSSVEIISGSSFSVTLNAADLAYLKQILNKNGTSSTGGTTYNLAAADDWNTVIGNTDISDSTNAITVSNVVVPSITSATYDGNTGVLVVTGTGFTHVSGANNDIVANKFTLTGQGGATYTLTDTANVDTT